MKIVLPSSLDHLGPLWTKSDQLEINITGTMESKIVKQLRGTVTQWFSGPRSAFRRTPRSGPRSGPRSAFRRSLRRTCRRLTPWAFNFFFGKDFCPRRVGQKSLENKKFMAHGVVASPIETESGGRGELPSLQIGEARQGGIQTKVRVGFPRKSRSDVFNLCGRLAFFLSKWS